MKEKINMVKNYLKSKKGKALMMGAGLISALSYSQPVHAEGEDLSTITTSLTSALTSSKSDFITAVAGVVTVAVGYFIVKFVVVQVVNFFSTIAKK